MQKIYYDKNKNFSIIDVSGIKSIDDIKSEFEKKYGKLTLQKISINEAKEYASLDVNGNLIKKQKIVQVI